MKSALWSVFAALGIALSLITVAPGPAAASQPGVSMSLSLSYRDQDLKVGRAIPMQVRFAPDRNQSRVALRVKATGSMQIGEEPAQTTWAQMPAGQEQTASLSVVPVKLGYGQVEVSLTAEAEAGRWLSGPSRTLYFLVTEERIYADWRQGRLSGAHLSALRRGGELSWAAYWLHVTRIGQGAGLGASEVSSIRLDGGQQREAWIHGHPWMRIRLQVRPEEGDVDLFLYDPSGSLIGSSGRRGTVSEEVAITAQTYGHYRAIVIARTPAVYAERLETRSREVGAPGRDRLVRPVQMAGACFQHTERNRCIGWLQTAVGLDPSLAAAIPAPVVAVTLPGLWGVALVVLLALWRPHRPLLLICSPFLLVAAWFTPAQLPFWILLLLGAAGLIRAVFR